MTKNYDKGYKRGLTGKAPTKHNDPQYFLGYADGYREYQNSQSDLFILEVTHAQPSESEAKRIGRMIHEAMTEAPKAESLRQSKINLIEASILEREDWIEERQKQIKALKALRNDLMYSPIQTRPQVRAIIDEHDHREAKAILNGHNTNCSRFRD